MEESKRFLSRFSEGVHCFQWFAESEEAKKNALPAGYVHAEYGNVAGHLASLNQAGYGVYFAINETDGKKRQKETMVRVRALFLDLDGEPLEPVLAEDFKPHFVVETSPGKYQCYWLVNGLPLSEYSQWQLALASRFGGDKTVKDTTRVGRLPGSIHHKGDPFESRIIYEDDYKPYPAMILVEGLSLPAYVAKEGSEKFDLKTAISEPKKPSERHEALIKFAGQMAFFNAPDEFIYAGLRALNQTFDPPIPDNRFEQEAVRAIAYVREKAGPVVEIELGEGVAPEPEAFLPDKLCLEAPGIVGELTRAIVRSAVFPQPALALQAALCAMSIVKNRNYVGFFKNQCNIYSIGLAPTGAGKNHQLECIDKILDPIGLGHTILGRLVSVAGLAAGLQRSGGIGVSVIDEAGMFFEGLLLANKSGAVNKADVRESLMSMFNAKRKVRGSEYINRQGAVSRTDIDSPHLSIYGTSTAETFWRSIKNEHAIDGFVSRFLYFKPEYPDPERNWDKADFELGDAVLDELHEYTNRRAFNAVPHSLKMPLSVEGKFKDVVAEHDLKARNATSPGLRALCVRVAEYFDKILVLAADRDAVDEKIFDWAYSVMDACIRSFHADMKQHTYETRTEEVVAKVYNIIAQSPGKSILHQDWVRAAIGLSKVEREAALQTLKDSGIVRSTICSRSGKAALAAIKNLK